MAASTTSPAVPDGRPFQCFHRPSGCWAGTESSSLTAARVGRVALNHMRLALGVEFLWAFFDKTFGLGYATPDARAWAHGGSATRTLSGVDAGPLQTSSTPSPGTRWSTGCSCSVCSASASR